MSTKIANKYRLGEPVHWQVKHAYIEANGNDIYKFGRNFEDYFYVLDRNLNKDPDAVEARLLAAYDLDDDVFIPIKDSCFVTDDEDLFVEMYRHLKLDFVHDFKSGLFFMDMFGGHEVFMNYLYEGIHGKKKYDWDKGAELYVIEGLGFFKSSQSSRVWIGPDVPIPDFFRPWKQHVEVMEP